MGQLPGDVHRGVKILILEKLTDRRGVDLQDGIAANRKRAKASKKAHVLKANRRVRHTQVSVEE